MNHFPDGALVGVGLKCLAARAEQESGRAWMLQAIVDAMRTCLKAGGTLFFCGNGGSAADAQHIAAEYVVRYNDEQRPLRAVALTTDSSVLTAAGNDLGFESIFARQIEALGRPGDLLIVHSTSGESENCLRAAAQARKSGMKTIAFLGGDGGGLKFLAEYEYIVHDPRTCHVQEIHLAVQHQIAAILTKELG